MAGEPTAAAAAMNVDDGALASQEKVSKKAKVEGARADGRPKQPPDWDAILGGVGGSADPKLKAPAPPPKGVAPTVGVQPEGSAIPKPKAASSQRADVKAVNDAKKEQSLKTELAAILVPETHESGRGRTPPALVAPKVDTGARKRPTSASRPATSVEEEVPKRRRHYEAEQVRVSRRLLVCTRRILVACATQVREYMSKQQSKRMQQAELEKQKESVRRKQQVRH